MSMARVGAAWDGQMLAQRVRRRVRVLSFVQPKSNPMLDFCDWGESRYNSIVQKVEKASDEFVRLAREMVDAGAMKDPIAVNHLRQIARTVTRLDRSALKMLAPYDFYAAACLKEGMMRDPRRRPLSELWPELSELMGATRSYSRRNPKRRYTRRRIVEAPKKIEGPLQ
jgi:hypothetical protein